jgi:dihydroneopterin aldolase/2-amino-4-hydroxy-6-hydroxymethyldihydropteridine diphosphokinase
MDPRTSKIKIKDLEVFANHGVFPEENVLGQKFLVSAVLYTDTRVAGKEDDLEKSVDYGEICIFIDTFLKAHTYKLIESVAENMAEEILIKFAGIESLKLEIEKPWAPVGLPLDTVSVEIERGWHTAYIALGSNMGDREEYLNKAVEALAVEKGCRVIKVSSFIETAPYGVTDQDDFLNGCLELKTLLTPHELLETLNRIEKEAGRERLLRWGPRTLDLDIIFYDDLIYGDDSLCIPHVDYKKREFVLAPLSEIAPYKHDPSTGKTMVELFEELK